MLKYSLFCVFALLLVVANASEDKEEAQLTSSYREQDGFGHFKHGHKVSNGISVQAEGDGNGVHGEYFLPGENGEQIRVTYTADSTGFHPKVEEH